MSSHCQHLQIVTDKEEDPESPRVLRHIELIDDEAAEYGIKIVQMSDRLMAKKYGFRNPPGITYFRKGKYINYDGDIDDEEEILDWLTNPENMELTDHIERINRKMFHKIRGSTDYLAVFFCKYSNVLLNYYCYIIQLIIGIRLDRQQRVQTMQQSISRD